MKRIFFCVSLVLTGLVTSCVDKYEEVDADSKPSWLGGSIYAELENPTKLTGTFKNYLRLVNDLGYAETFNRTGSLTIFPANDEAFSRFFKDGNNAWGVSSYEQLTESQKKLLLNSSMLDNALLLSLLPNTESASGSTLKGQALKHYTRVSVYDSVQHVTSAAEMPKNNPYWTNFYKKGLYMVSDNTIPMMVHLTREYMLNHDITTAGDNSDFAILTGTPYTAGTAYIFNNQVVKSDVTCQNGYIQQLQDVLVPPGNMAQVLRRHADTKFMSRMLDYYSAPYYDANTTNDYNNWAKANGKPQIDSIYQMRFLSNRSQGGASNLNAPEHVGGKAVVGTKSLGYDPGWNAYYPPQAKAASGDEFKDMGAIFVPDDKAMKQYFLPGGAGAFLIDIYGAGAPAVINDEAHLEENLDSLYTRNSGIITSIVKNLMKPSFAATVPSKFSTVTNDAAENMGLSIDLVNRKSDGKYDITIANNGAIYVLNKFIAPDEFQAVLAPCHHYPDLKVMDWAVYDQTYLNVDFKYYLLAMSANYAFFVPEDSAFNCYYIDPASLGHLAEDKITSRPDVLHFYYDANATKQPYLKCERYYYDVETGQITGIARPVDVSKVASQLVDILNYHTLVLKSGEVIGGKKYYQTKHGGTIYVDGKGGVMGEWQKSGMLLGRSLATDTMMRAPQIKKTYSEKNGNTYRLDRVIQAPVESVYSVLQKNGQFSEFFNACNGFGNALLLRWAGISPDEKVDANNNKLGYSDQDAYIVFTRNYKLGTTTIANACLDYNVKMFNTYNYTLFAPDNTAMQTAYDNGLPKWTDVSALYEKYGSSSTIGTDNEDPEEKADADKAKKMIDAIRDFVRYHFVTNAVYADDVVEPNRHGLTMSANSQGVAREVEISGGSGLLSVKDATGNTITVNASDTGKLVNKMTRDYWFNASKENASEILTSSFCAIHQISQPLCGNSTGTFSARKK